MGYQLHHGDDMIDHVTDHTTQALDLLLERFKGKPNLAAFLSAFMEQVQDIEDAIVALADSRIIDKAQGAQLDRIGRIVGQERGARADDVFRMYIKARVRLNLSSGRPDDCLSIVRLLVDADVGLLYEDEDELFFQITADKPISGGEDIARILRQAKPACVRGVFRWHTSVATFQFSDTDTVETSRKQGFGDASIAVGGYLSAASEGMQ